MDELLAPLRWALDRVGDRWTLLVVAALVAGPRRFADLQEAVGGIAPAVLSSRLKALEAGGLLVASPYQHRPVRLRYELTARGRGLEDAIRLLAAWGGGTDTPRHPACGTALEVTWWCPTCDVTADAPEHGLRHV